MRNVAPGQLGDDADIIAGAIGGSAEAAERANYYTAGVKYLFPPSGGGYEPYIGLGFGAARVTKDVTFSVNGAELSELDLLSQYGVQLGADLAGSTVKPMMVVAAGVSRAMGRALFDVSYRYGLIFSKTGSIEEDKALNTSRIQVGVGFRF
jgi:opacity protein-like surface antigen